MPTKQQHSPDSPAPCIHTWKLPHLIVHKRYRGAGFVLLFLLFTVSSAFAQKTRLIDPINGRTDGNCGNINPANANGPCTLERAFELSGNEDEDVFLIRVRRAGGSTTLAAPTVALDKRFRFGTYVQGNATPVKGTIQFTGTFTIAAAGEFRLDPNASVQFENITLSAGARTFPFFWIADKSEERIAITDTLTIPKGESVRLPALVVSRSFTVKGGTNAEKKTSELRAGGEPSGGGNDVESPLLVQSGATLRIDGVNLVVHVRKEFFVEGMIENVTKGASHPLWIAFLNDNDAPGNRTAAIKTFVRNDRYQPLYQGFDHTDCFRIRGKGTIPAGIFAIATGNVCVELKRVGPVTVSGSLKNDSFTSKTSKKISTDLIFREDVVVDGDVMQWNDSRILFEKTAAIRGDVILQDGGTPYTNTDDYGEANITSDSGVRGGWQDADATDDSKRFTCTYSNDHRRGYTSFDGGVRTDHIPGIHFSGAATIAGNLNVYSNTLTETTTGATADATQCAPRVLFMAPLAQDKGTTAITLTSSVGGSLVMEDTVSFGGKGRVYLDTDSLKAKDSVVRKTAHNLQIGGDLAAGGKTVGMGYPAVSRVDGMCTQNDTRLPFGNRLVLTDAAESVVIGDASNGLTLDALVTLGDLRVEPGKGPLTVTTLHVGPRAQLTATKDVKVTESLILEGELSGELDEASTIKTLTYGSRNTDIVKKAALVMTLDALSIHIGRGELRLDEMVQTKTLGLCSGTLSLVDAESTTDSTLHVTEQITVQSGMLEKDTNDPGSISTDKAKTANMNDRYILTYITPGKRTVTDALEWFDPRDVIVEHAKAEIKTGGDHSLTGKLTVSKGKLMVDGMLTVGTSILDRTSAANVGKYSVEVTAGELHTEGQDVMVHGKVTVSNKSKLMTGGGDLQVLGRVNKGQYIGNTAQVTIAKEAMINLGKGTLMLGPEDTAKRDGLETGRTTAQVHLVLKGQLLADTLYIPKGSKRTHIVSGMSAAAHENLFPVVLFDGRKTPNDRLTNNRVGYLYFNWAETNVGNGRDTGTTTVLDSLAVMGEGIIEFYGKKVEIRKEVHLRSGKITTKLEETLEFKDHVQLSGTGKMTFSGTGDPARVLVDGNFLQTNDTGQENWRDFPGISMGNQITKTVMGDLVVEADTRYITPTASNLIVHGDLLFDYTYDFERNRPRGHLDAALELRGSEPQEVRLSSDPRVELGDVTVNNPKGIVLASEVRQRGESTLTLRRGTIRSMPADSMYKWVVRNVQGEEELRGRLSAQEGNTCGSDGKQKCKASILRGSGQSYASTPVGRDLLQGIAGTGAESGGYLFPVGMEHKTDQDTLSHYRPVILQLPSDLNDTTAVTVSPIMVPEGAMPAWPVENLTVPRAGGSLTLDVHAPIFWKVDLGEEELPTNTNLRVAADGIQNVTDITGLRIVQWNCEWKHPKLAGRVPAQTGASSFAVNGYINGVVNLTQEGIGLGSCAIFGIAADGSENPIDQADLSGGRAMVQFIHNVPAPGSAPMEIDLGEVRISNNLRFRTATAYRPVGAGETQDVTIQPVGAPAAQAITDTVSLTHGRNYAVIVHGSLADPKLMVLDMRMTSSVATKAEVRLVHGSADLGPAQVQMMDPTDPMMPVMTLAGNLMLDEATRRYISLDPSVQVMQVKSADGDVEEFYELDLSGYGGQTLVMNLSGTKRDLTILGVDRDGKIVPVQIVTGAENEMAELPTEFVLHGNYPNPFNPSTRIQFDLPESAQVQIQIVDMLGRRVITLPAQEMEAGANQSMELNAGSLASGTYLYRLVASGAKARHVKTGRMTLVK